MENKESILKQLDVIENIVNLYLGTYEEMQQKKKKALSFYDTLPTASKWYPTQEERYSMSPKQINEKKEEENFRYNKQNEENFKKFSDYEQQIGYKDYIGEIRKEYSKLPNIFQDADLIDIYDYEEWIVASKISTLIDIIRFMLKLK